MKFEYLKFAYDFSQEQLALFRKLLSTYEGFRLYSYRKSDFFQLEQISNFFTNSFEKMIMLYLNRYK